jgi:glycerophosphoryl diester phosphodiesterase
MAINSSGDKLYTLLESSLTDDPDKKRLLINEFDINTENYTAGKTFAYKLDANGTNIGDMTAVNDHQFLVIERDPG